MAHPAAALQKAVVRAVLQSAALRAACGGDTRLYDRVPAKWVLPYITIGDIQILDDTNCGPAWEAFVVTHVWSDKVGKPEAASIADALGEALDVELDLDGFICTVNEHRETRIITEPDGLTTHAALTHRYLIDKQA